MWRLKEQLSADSYDTLAAAETDKQSMQFWVDSLPLGWNEKLELEIVEYDSEWLLVLQVFRAYPERVLDYISPKKDYP